MKPFCDCCGSDKPVAEITNPSVGEYTACDPCMTAGKRPLCHQVCGGQSDLMEDRVLWCSTCHDVARLARENASRVAMQDRQKQIQDDIQVQIDAAVVKALAARGF